MEMIRVEAHHIPTLLNDSVACIGYFDGIHKGHQALIKKTIELCDKDSTPSVICFDEDPHIVMNKIQVARYITPQKDRLQRFQELGIKRCFLLHFDVAMMKMSKQSFIQDILEKLRLKALICGDDFKFAYQGEGNINDLKNRNFTLHSITPICYGEHKISSSIIEQNIMDGKMDEVFTQLGVAYTIKGIVITGNKVGGAKLGFPTANLQLSDHYIIPKKGVYEGIVTVFNNQYKAIINVGHNPTMNYQENISIEAHLLDFNQNLYEEEVAFSFIEYIRDEQKFSTIDELIAQLNKDEDYVRKNKKDVRK